MYAYAHAHFDYVSWSQPHQKRDLRRYSDTCCLPALGYLHFVWSGIVNSAEDYSVFVRFRCENDNWIVIMGISDGGFLGWLSNIHGARGVDIDIIMNILCTSSFLNTSLLQKKEEIRLELLVTYALSISYKPYDIHATDHLSFVSVDKDRWWEQWLLLGQ